MNRKTYYFSEELVSILKLNFGKYSNEDDVWLNFERLETDEERMKFVRELTPLKDTNSIVHENFVDQKSVVKAVDFRRKGNEAFNKEDYKSAIKFYTESMALAPYHASVKVTSETANVLETETALSIAVANRSAALYELKKYKSCLKDISFAMEMNYPQSLLYKLYARRAKCLQALGRNENVIEAVEMALDSLTLSDITKTKKESIRSELEDLRSSTHSTEKTNDPKHYVHLKPSYGQNSVLLNCSDCVEVKRTEDMGRGLFATRDIKIGDVIMVQKPFVAVVLDDYIYTNCHNCCKQCSTLIPCPYCTLAMFCSENCREISWERYHNVECKLLPVLKHIQLVSSGVRALKTVITAFNMFKSMAEFYDTVKLFNTIHKSDDWHTPTDVKSQYNDYYQVYKPIKMELPVKRLFTDCMFGTYLCLILEKETDFFSGKNLKTEDRNLNVEQVKIFVACLLMRHLHNPVHMVYNLKDKNDMRDFDLNIIAEAAYPLPINLINHSCAPNVIHHTVYDNQIAVCALRNIKKDEQVFDSYGPTFAKYPREERQAHLLKFFHFKCCCIACTRNWPTYEVLNNGKLMMKCEFCNAELCRSSPENFVVTKICNNCNRSNNTLRTVGKSAAILQKIFQMRDIKSKESFDIFVSMVNLINQHFITPTADSVCMELNLTKHFYYTAFDEEY